MATALYDGVGALDSVVIAPKTASHFTVQRRAGQTGTVCDRFSDGRMSVVFDSGAMILVGRDEVARVD